MRVLIFEWLSGGGLWMDSASPDERCAIQRQGAAMLSAVAEDFQLAGHDVLAPIDDRVTVRLPPQALVSKIGSAISLPIELERLARSADAILLIAPECAGRLLQVFDWVRNFSSKLISPDRQFIELASNKTAMSAFLQSNGIAVPKGVILPADGCSIDLPFPVVMKPNFGAGSDSVQVAASVDRIKWPTDGDEYRVEQFIPGAAVSVSAIATGEEIELLPPTGQRFDAQPIGHYAGADFPLPGEIAQRANSLAQQCVLALPTTRGYFGMDIVIANEGPEFDCVIEVNPRLTCSYVHLRQIVDQNLAAMMVENHST